MDLYDHNVKEQEAKPAANDDYSQQLIGLDIMVTQVENLKLMIEDITNTTFEQWLSIPCAAIPKDMVSRLEKCGVLNLGRVR